DLAPAWTSVPAIEPSKPRQAISPRALGLIIGLVALLLLSALAGLTFFGLHRASPPPPGTAFEHRVPAAIPEGSGVRIMCGSSRSNAQDREGNLWSRDRNADRVLSLQKGRVYRQKEKREGVRYEIIKQQ